MQKFEKMAKLNMPEDERSRVYARVEKLLEGFKVLDSFDTPEIMKTSEPSGELREDVALKNFTRDEILSSAPEEYNGYFAIPKVV